MGGFNGKLFGNTLCTLLGWGPKLREYTLSRYLVISNTEERVTT